jgi:signal transduction histidine kinase
MVETAKSSNRATLRQRILAFVGALILVSLLGSTVSLYRISEVSRLLDGINKVSVPLGRLFAQMQSDAEVFQRELERGLGFSHWKDPHWKPRPVPRWIEDVLQSEMSRMNELVQIESDWAPAEARQQWREWSKNVSEGLQALSQDAAKLYEALDKKNEAAAAQIYPRWITGLDQWRRELRWGASEYDRVFRQTFTLAESRVSELKTGLEIILAVVIAFSMLLLWLGERTLRPLGELTQLAREIARRGLRKEDKALVPAISVHRDDEVSQLSREFHSMATALLEREKTVDAQKHRLEDQNKLLREIGELNENILKSIDSVLLVTDLNGRITQCNPVSAAWLQVPMNQIIGTRLRDWAPVQTIMGDTASTDLKAFSEAVRVGPATVNDKIYAGQLLPLRDSRGAVLVLEDMTEELSLQERLRRAENLAAVGRMSAQVAHEVRNPLHSIGLEAEVAVEAAAKLGNPALKQSLQSILASVDRLEKITENYLKLSRLSTGEKACFDLGDVLEDVLATYAPVCEAQGVRVDWRREAHSDLRVFGDRDLMEQVLGNLFRNALQALETSQNAPRIEWALGNAESGRVWASIEDNGPGLSPEIQSKLFTPFVTTRAQGTGLGLSFVKKVMEDHGGTIQARMGESHRGAHFELTLPSAGLSAVLSPASSEKGAELNV